MAVVLGEKRLRLGPLTFDAKDNWLKTVAIKRYMATVKQEMILDW